MLCNNHDVGCIFGNETNLVIFILRLNRLTSDLKYVRVNIDLTCFELEVCNRIEVFSLNQK